LRTHLTALATTLGLLLAGAAGAASLQPFVVEYQAKYTWMSVGDIRLELKREGRPGRWILETRGDATGLARLVANGTLVQTSWMQVEGDSVRPLKFRLDDGMERAKEDVSLEFDWQAARATGIAKGNPVDEKIPPNTQDPVSIQFAMMLALQNGQEPGQLPMIDGRKLKLYDHTFLRKERVKTPAGSFDTVVYRSARPESSREAVMWLAPELGYLAVQVEQYRKGKRLFAMYMQKYTPGR
jgi:hypothetical protein